ncbi:MAG TPA: hypothetical protein VHX38_28625 [Pseudonocardiaceae bacterium]|nr:hypothetical protein [Pseudonocardiaceae bacterium]
MSGSTADRKEQEWTTGRASPRILRGAPGEQPNRLAPEALADLMATPANAITAICGAG